MPSPPQGGLLGVLPTPAGLGGSLASGGGLPSAIHFWPMNEGTGATFFDSIGSLNFTASGVTWSAVPGMGVPAVAGFNSITPTTAVASSYNAGLDFSGTQPWTHSCWAYITAIGAIFSNLNPATYAGGWEVGNVGTGLGSYGVVNSGSQFLGEYFTPNTTVAQHIVTTYDGSNGIAGLKTYVNGSLQATTQYSATAPTTPANSAALFHMGTRTDGATAAYGGALAYMRVYTQVLTSAQVSTLYALGPQ